MARVSLAKWGDTAQVLAAPGLRSTTDLVAFAEALDVGAVVLDDHVARFGAYIATLFSSVRPCAFVSDAAEIRRVCLTIQHAISAFKREVRVGYADQPPLDFGRVNGTSTQPPADAAAVAKWSAGSKLLANPAVTTELELTTWLHHAHQGSQHLRTHFHELRGYVERLNLNATTERAVLTASGAADYLESCFNSMRTLAARTWLAAPVPDFNRANNR